MPIQRTKHKNVIKVDRPDHYMEGYLVRVQWKKQLRSKFFSIGKFGDWIAALDAAIEFRNKTEHELGKPRTEQLIVGTTRMSNTGLRGIRKMRSGHTDYAEAAWVDHTGRKRVTRFSMNRHGKRKALKLAQEARERGEQERRTYPRRARPAIVSVRHVAEQPADRFDMLLAQMQQMALE